MTVRNPSEHDRRLRLSSVAVWIKRRRNPVSRTIYDVAKSLQTADLPAPRLVYGPMLAGYQAGTHAIDFLSRQLLYQPMFRARCERCGPRLVLEHSFRICTATFDSGLEATALSAAAYVWRAGCYLTRQC